MEALIQGGPAATLGGSAGVQKGWTGIPIFKAGAFRHAHTSQARRWMAPKTRGRNARGPSPPLGEPRMDTMHLLENPMHSTTEGGNVCLQQKKKKNKTDLLLSTV